jgi:branched-subunit amino acid aminotransferase/4-amino-4-deoxychorismate lyase
LKQAHEKKAAEALWFTTDGRLAEGCVSNVFIVKDSTVYTPAANTPILPGIARKTVCEIARNHNIALIEKELSIDDLLSADEVFLTNVIMQVMPVAAIEKHTVGQGKPGEVTKKIAELYDKFVKESCQNK